MNLQNLEFERKFDTVVMRPWQYLCVWLFSPLREQWQSAKAMWKAGRQDEAIAPYSVSREVSHSVLKCKTVLMPSFLCVQRPEAKDPGCMYCWHSSSVPYLSKGACGPAEAWRLGWGMSSFSPLPLLLPKQLTPSSDVVLWLDSKQHCSCGHGVLSVSESESCWLSSWE